MLILSKIRDSFAKLLGDWQRDNTLSDYSKRGRETEEKERQGERDRETDRETETAREIER